MRGIRVPSSHPAAGTSFSIEFLFSLPATSATKSVGFLRRCSSRSPGRLLCIIACFVVETPAETTDAVYFPPGIYSNSSDHHRDSDSKDRSLLAIENTDLTSDRNNGPAKSSSALAFWAHKITIYKWFLLFFFFLFIYNAGRKVSFLLTDKKA